LREKFLKFFESKGHKVIPSASLIPENDPIVLFITAGMHPLIPYLLGQSHPLGQRLCGVQKCLRTNDIEEVGDNRHLTFFEMLGNWSLGKAGSRDGIGGNGYFKEQAIKWSFEFLTKELNLPKENLSVSVFQGEGLIPGDEESAKIWRGLGIPDSRIVYLGKKDNWWEPTGQAGPCGPDTEIFFWIGPGPAPEKFDSQNGLWLEIWNNVFMEYEKRLKGGSGEDKNGEYKELSQKNVDTGMGLERMLMALNNKKNPFETELFLPIIKKIKSFSSNREKNENRERMERIIADHLKASVFILAEGIAPSNTERGYVLRRLLRRSLRFSRMLGIKEKTNSEIAEVIIDLYKDAYPEVYKKRAFIFRELNKEEDVFGKTLNRGLKELNAIKGKKISGQQAFDLYQTYGFPIEMAEEIAKEKGLEVDREGFERELKKHRELSRSAAAGRFKSGLEDHSRQSVKYHTATHLLQAALRQVLGKEIEQKGSNITTERLRFDFAFSRDLTADEIKQVEGLVNKKIKEGLEVEKEEMPLKKALNSGALSFFQERYPERVSVYTIFNPKTGEVFSREICAGPHVPNTSDLGRFEIIKEESSGRGVRRIRAILKSN